MTGIDDILRIDSDEAFGRAALDVFRFQAAACEPYARYLSLMEIDPRDVRRAEEIPHLPIELFKTQRIYCGEGAPQKVFTSSNTGATTPSRHYMADLTIYERDFTASFERFYGPASQWSIYGLLPNYLQREGSSLVYMVDRLIARSGSGGFYLDDYDKMLDDMSRDPRRKILLGVSYALWDLAERYAPKLRDTIVMETGGMKGRRRELPKTEFHAILTEAFGVESIHSEYGMAELTSQAYSSGGGIFRAPEWMRVTVRDINDPLSTLPGLARRHRHNGPRQHLLVRLHLDAGRGPHLRRRLVLRRGSPHGGRRAWLQPARTVTAGGRRTERTSDNPPKR